MPSVPGRSEQITPGLGHNSLRMKTKLLIFSYQALQGPALPIFLTASHTCAPSHRAFLCPCPPRACAPAWKGPAPPPLPCQLHHPIRFHHKKAPSRLAAQPCSSARNVSQSGRLLFPEISAATFTVCPPLLRGHLSLQLDGDGRTWSRRLGPSEADADMEFGGLTCWLGINTYQGKSKMGDAELGRGRSSTQGWQGSLSWWSLWRVPGTVFCPYPEQLDPACVPQHALVPYAGCPWSP